MKRNFKSLSIRLTEEEHDRLQRAANIKNRGNKAGYILEQIDAAAQIYDDPFVKFVNSFCPSKLEAAIKWCAENNINQVNLCDDLVRFLMKRIESGRRTDPDELLDKDALYPIPLIHWEDIEGWQADPFKKIILPHKKWVVTTTLMSKNAFAVQGLPGLEPAYNEEKYIFCDTLQQGKDPVQVFVKTEGGEIALGWLDRSSDKPSVRLFPYKKGTNKTQKTSWDVLPWEVVEIRVV